MWLIRKHEPPIDCAGRILSGIVLRMGCLLLDKIMNKNMSRLSSSDVESTTKQNLRWLFVRLFVATVLFVAASLKAHQLANVSVFGEGLLHARWFNTFIVEFELSFGIWLIFGMLPRPTRFATIGLFSVFAFVSFYKVLVREASCGCFGMIDVPPKLTLLFDVVIVTVLICFGHSTNFFTRSDSRDRKKFCVYLVSYIGVTVIVGVLVYGVIVSKTHYRLTEVGHVYETGVVELYPTEWIGRVFPLRDYITNGHSLMHGSWTVMLVRSGCSKCESLVGGNLPDTIVRWNNRVVYLDISGRSPIRLKEVDECRKSYRLGSDVFWSATVPIALELDEGVVRKVVNL
ncbi:MAG: hypothetical protein LBQ66_05680 [Planctomycetaceae bacterium]|jgi:uncharacterized membrane protein YphA (DoxX/SURF4 family)|nr:hypothetical protein [Planctomycetaceae bacterium]